MKIHDNQTRRSGTGNLGTLAAALATCLFAVLPAFATPGGGGGDGHDNQGGGNDNREDPPGQNPPSVGGDETVGTLPLVGGGRIDLPITRHWRGIEPALYLEGSYDDLRLAIRGARGRGFVSCEVLDAARGQIRLAFHGDVVVVLDRELASALAIDIGMAVPESFGTGRARISSGDGPVRIIGLRPGILPLPVASMIGPAVQDPAPLGIRTGNADGVRTPHSIAVSGDLVILRQSN